MHLSLPDHWWTRFYGSTLPVVQLRVYLLNMPILFRSPSQAILMSCALVIAHLLSSYQNQVASQESLVGLT